ncbi:hypothetical protein HNY73_013790 [Argiope bruennichi]|uniref:Uncharacterized protein n=1 Tax=Argiope bruennichi TaxID=94029 RepID=A0A8T0EM79_ARGBR|nr:hypothetical protein HNY73_013790 [Argiope bruennichi]
MTSKCRGYFTTECREPLYRRSHSESFRIFRLDLFWAARVLRILLIINRIFSYRRQPAASRRNPIAFIGSFVLSINNGTEMLSAEAATSCGGTMAFPNLLEKPSPPNGWWGNSISF